MEVFVLETSYQFDSGDVGAEVEVFDTIEKAKSAMKKEIKQARKDFKNCPGEHEETTLRENDMSWSIWESGEYCYNHIDVTIYQRPIL